MTKCGCQHRISAPRDICKNMDKNKLTCQRHIWKKKKTFTEGFFFQVNKMHLLQWIFPPFLFTLNCTFNSFCLFPSGHLAPLKCYHLASCWLKHTLTPHPRSHTAQIHNFWSHIFKRWWQKQQQVNRCQTEKKSSTLPGAFQKLQFQTLTLKNMVLCTEKPATNETLQMRLLSSCSQVALFYTSCYRVQRPLQVYSPVGAALVFVWPLVAELCSPQRPHCSAFILLTLQLLHSPQLVDQAGLT